MAEKKIVLIVDDEEDVRDYLSTLLQDNGYETVTANDGEEGLKKVREVKPHLITLDVSMPEKSGVKFYREMKGSDDFKHIPIVMVTGVSGEFERFISTRKQVPPPEGFVSKPVDQAKILGMIEELTA
jgi:CheY-like chemotaxis protein